MVSLFTFAVMFEIEVKSFVDASKADEFETTSKVCFPLSLFEPNYPLFSNCKIASFCLDSV